MATENSTVSVTTGPTGMRVKLHGDVGIFNVGNIVSMVRLPGHLLRTFLVTSNTNPGVKLCVLVAYKVTYQVGQSPNQYLVTFE